MSDVNYPAAPRQRWPLVVAAALAVALMAAAALLWAQAGTALFFEVIRTGWAACFG